MDPILQEANQKIIDSIEHLKKELSSIRAGRANASLLEDIPINAYGAQMKLIELGTITAPQPSLLTIQVWDAGVLKDIEKAIMSAKLGLTPSIDGTTVRVPIPPLTAERREEFVKLAHTKGEEAKVEIRQTRQDQRADSEQDQKSGLISEDELTRIEKQLQDIVDKASAQIDNLVKEKQADLREI